MSTSKATFNGILEIKDLGLWRTLEDPGPLRTQNLRGPRTLEHSGPLRTQGSWGPSILEDRRPLRTPDPSEPTAMFIQRFENADLFFQRYCGIFENICYIYTSKSHVTYVMRETIKSGLLLFKEHGTGSASFSWC